MNLLIGSLTLTSFLHRASQFGLSLLVQSTIVLSLALLGGWLARRKGPALQSLIYKSGLVAVIACAVITVGFGGFSKSVWRLSPPLTSDVGILESFLAGSSSIPKPSLPGVDVKEAPAASPAAGPSVPELTKSSLYSIMTLLWLLGAAVMVAWLVICHLLVLQLRRSSRSLGGDSKETLQDLARAMKVTPPQLLAGEAVQSPFLTGLLRPAILLPAKPEEEFDDTALRAILAHELTHLARRDCWWNIGSRILCAVGWMQPLLWAVTRRLEQSSEEVCDQAVLQMECSPKAYAQCLMTMAERLVISPQVRAVGAGVVGFKSSLGRRVERIMDSSRERITPMSGKLRAAVIVGALSAGMLGMFLFSVGAKPGGKSGGAAGVQLGQAQEKPDLSSPKATLRSFIAAINRADFPAAAACVRNGSSTAIPKEMVDDFKKQAVTLAITDSVAEETGFEAKIALELTMGQGGNLSTPSKKHITRETVALMKTQDTWLINSPLPPAQPKMKNGEPEEIVAMFVAILAHPDLMIQARGKAVTTVCLSNLKQVALGLIMFAQDHNESFALRAATYKAQAMPYIKSEMVFHCPSDKPGAVSYSFNANLQGVPLSNISNISETVLVYEGKNGQLDFHHDGMAVVGFGDGHVQLVSPEKARTLRWKP
jgi:beta-lactamase regulating signal transducer with metallopeptidase domain